MFQRLINPVVGFLSGKYSKDGANDYARFKSDANLRNRYFHSNDFEVLGVIEEIAKEEKISVAQVSLSWVLAQDGITSPIIGVTNMKHLEEAIAVVDMNLDHDYFRRIDEAYSSRPIIGHSYNVPDKMNATKK